MTSHVGKRSNFEPRRFVPLRVAYTDYVWICLSLSLTLFHSLSLSLSLGNCRCSNNRFGPNSRGADAAWIVESDERDALRRRLFVFFFCSLLQFLSALPVDRIPSCVRRGTKIDICARARKLERKSQKNKLDAPNRWPRSKIKGL